MGAGRGAGKRGAPHQRQVGPVVADDRDPVPGEAQAREQRFARGQLVGSAVGGVHQAEVGDPATHRRRIAAGDDDRHDPALGQQLEPVAVEGRERLEGLALLADVDPAVGEDAVDIEDRRGDALARAARRQQQLGGEGQRRGPAGRWAAPKPGRAPSGGSDQGSGGSPFR